jgi:hypothetical protein
MQAPSFPRPTTESFLRLTIEPAASSIENSSASSFGPFALGRLRHDEVRGTALSPQTGLRSQAHPFIRKETE